MFPLFWHWSPQFFLPWSGSVKQDIELDRFFSAIPPAAGNGTIEQAAFRRASYGSQLGWITEVLLESVGDVPADSRSALGKLRRANVDIQRLKLAPDAVSDAAPTEGGDDRENSAGEAGHAGHADMGGAQIAAYLRALRRDDRERYEELSRQLLPLLQPQAMPSAAALDAPQPASANARLAALPAASRSGA